MNLKIWQIFLDLPNYDYLCKNEFLNKTNMEKEFVIEFEVEGIDANCMHGVFEYDDIECLAEDVKKQLTSMYGDNVKWFVIKDDGEDIYDSRKKHYDVTIHMRYDPEDLNEEDFELEAEDLDEAKEVVNNHEKIGIINYFVIEGIDNDDYYNSSEEPDFVDYC